MRSKEAGQIGGKEEGDYHTNPTQKWALSSVEMGGEEGRWAGGGREKDPGEIKVNILATFSL